MDSMAPRGEAQLKEAFMMKRAQLDAQYKGIDGAKQEATMIATILKQTREGKGFGGSEAMKNPTMQENFLMHALALLQVAEKRNEAAPLKSIFEKAGLQETLIQMAETLPGIEDGPVLGPQTIKPPRSPFS